MAAPMNPYAVWLSIRMTELFEAVVDAMDETSPSNSSSSASTSQKLADHQLRQLAAKQDDPQEDVVWNVCQETVEFNNDGPPSLLHPLTELYFSLEHRLHVFWANLHIPVPPNPPNPLRCSLTAWWSSLPQCWKKTIDLLSFHTIWVTTRIQKTSLHQLTIRIWSQTISTNGSNTFPRPNLVPEAAICTVLVGFSKPFPKVMKALAPWFQKKKYGMWQSALQSEKPTLLGWLLFQHHWWMKIF